MKFIKFKSKAQKIKKLLFLQDKIKIQIRKNKN